MLSLLISGPVQAVEDRCKSEEHSGSKKLSENVSLGCPIPDLRRRTSVANHNTCHSNVDRSLYYGSNNRSCCGSYNCC